MIEVSYDGDLADLAVTFLITSVRFAVKLLEEKQNIRKAVRVLRQALACFGGDDDGTEVLRG